MAWALCKDSGPRTRIKSGVLGLMLANAFLRLRPHLDAMVPGSAWDLRSKV